MNVHSSRIWILDKHFGLVTVGIMLNLQGLFLLIFGLVAALLVSVWFDVLPPIPPTPEIPVKYFGPGSRPAQESNEIRPFQINYKADVSIFR